jgi:hypothetical protein
MVTARRGRLGLAGLVLLAGCSHRTITVGGLTATETAVLTRNSLTATCTRYAASGAPSSSTSLATESTGDAATVHELLTGLGSILGGAAKATIPGGEQGARADAGGGDAACILEHFRGEAMPGYPPPTLDGSGVAASGE